jgi:hypothetical protein
MIVDLTALKRPRVVLMVDHSVERGDLYAPATGSHELGVVPLTKAEVNTVTGEYIFHARLSDWYAGIDPPKKKEPTTEDVLLRAVNTSIWLPVMAWRDHLIETDAREDVIWGLTWLIDHRKFPEERPDTPHGLCYCWSISVVPTDSSVPYCLPGILCNVSGLCGKFPTIHQAFWEAAIAVAAQKDSLSEPAARFTQENILSDSWLDEQDYHDPSEYE